MARKSSASTKAKLATAAKAKGDEGETPEGTTVATVDGDAPSDDDDSEVEPDSETTATVEPSIQWGQAIERNAGLDEPEARTRERLTSLVTEVLGLTATDKLIDEGWSLVVAARATVARDRALDALRKRVSSYSLPASLVELAMVAGADPAKASLMVTVEGEGEARKVVLSVLGGSTPRAAGSNGGSRGPRGTALVMEPAGVKGGAAQLLWDHKPLTSEMLRTVPELKGSEAYVNKNAAGKLMPGRSKPFGPNTNMNAGQALLAFTAPGTGNEALRSRITKGERSKS